MGKLFQIIGIGIIVGEVYIYQIFILISTGMAGLVIKDKKQAQS